MLLVIPTVCIMLPALLILAQGLKGVANLLLAGHALGDMQVTVGVIACAELALQLHALLFAQHGHAVFPRYESAELRCRKLGGQGVLLPQQLLISAVGMLGMIGKADAEFPKAPFLAAALAL